MKTKELKEKRKFQNSIMVFCAFMFSLALVLSITGCGDDDAPEMYTVTFETDGGTPVPSTQKVEKGKPATAPSVNPSKDGYSFIFWHVSGATSAYNFQTPINDNITLHAKWQEEDTPSGNSVIMTASGDYTNFRLMADGSLLAFGRNKNGELGTGKTTDEDSRVQVATGVAKVFAGKFTTFIVKTDGSLLGTGENRNGELGLGDATSRSNFTPIPVNDVKEIAPGSSHTHLLKNDGSVWATGFNAYGQLGVGDEKQRNSFTVTNLTSDVVAIAAGTECSLALKKDGTVWGTGYGSVGTLGSDKSYSTFTQILTGAKAIAAASYHSLVLMNDGTVYASGVNDKGQLGIGNNTDYVKSFTQAMDETGTPLTNVTAIFAGTQSSFAIKSDGTLWATGCNAYRQLDTGDNDNRDRFTKVHSDVQSMSAGYGHSSIIKNDGTPFLYGHVNPYDQLTGNSTIHIKVNDTYKYQYINSFRLSDCNMLELLFSGEDIITGEEGYKISVKPGTYNLTLWASNLTVPMQYTSLVVGNNKTITILYEWVSIAIGYRWTITYD